MRINPTHDSVLKFSLEVSVKDAMGRGMCVCAWYCTVHGAAFYPQCRTTLFLIVHPLVEMRSERIKVEILSIYICLDML